jgi:hypothetical protein
VKQPQKPSKTSGFKQIKRLPFYVKRAVEQIDEEIWQATANAEGGDGLSEEEKKQLEEFVLKLLNKAAKRTHKEENASQEQEKQES